MLAGSSRPIHETPSPPDSRDGLVVLGCHSSIWSRYQHLPLVRDDSPQLGIERGAVSDVFERLKAAAQSNAVSSNGMGGLGRYESPFRRPGLVGPQQRAHPDRVR